MKSLLVKQYPGLASLYFFSKERYITLNIFSGGVRPTAEPN